MTAQLIIIRVLASMLVMFHCHYAHSINDQLPNLANELLQVETSLQPTVETIQINNQSGTLMAWVNLQSSAKSRTLLSAFWDKEEKSYLVISDGWWEQLQKKGFYFVLDNTQGAFCVIDGYSVPDNTWTFIAAVWGKSAKGNYCKIYINGEFYIEKPIENITGKKIYMVGHYTDQFTDNPQQRLSKGMAGKWVYSRNKLSSKDILVLYIKTQQKYFDVNSSSTVLNNRVIFRDLNIRALFDEDIHWALSRKNTDDIIKLLKVNNFNYYIPCVWHGNGAYYKNSLNLHNTNIYSRLLKNDDPLAYLLQQAKLNGITVYPWFTITYQESSYMPNFSGSSTNKFYNIHNKEFRKTIASLINEAIKLHQLDGVNLDYMRSIDICKLGSCKEDFYKKYNFNIPDDHILLDDSSEVFKSISAWNSDALEELLRDIDPHLNNGGKTIISADVTPYVKETILQGQDGIKWLNDGLIDIAFVMQYTRHLNRVDLKRMQQNTKKGMIIPLLSTFDFIEGEVEGRALRGFISQIGDAVGVLGADGVAIYHRKTLTKEQMLYLQTQGGD